MRAALTLVAVGATGALVAGAGASAPAPCSPQSTARPTVALVEDLLDVGSSRAVATHPLDVSFEFSPGPDGSRPDAAGVAGSGPPGVIVRRSSSGDSSLVVTAPRAGAVPLNLTWRQGDGCAGSGQVTIQMAAARRPYVRLRPTGFHRGAWPGEFTGDIERRRGGDASPLRVLVRTGSRTVLDRTVDMGGEGPGPLTIRRAVGRVRLKLSGAEGVYRLSTAVRRPSSLPPRFRASFGLAVSLTQSGRRVGGMSSVVSCGLHRVGTSIFGIACRTSGSRRA